MRKHSNELIMFILEAYKKKKDTKNWILELITRVEKTFGIKLTRDMVRHIIEDWGHRFEELNDHKIMDKIENTVTVSPHNVKSSKRCDETRVGAVEEDRATKEDRAPQISTINDRYIITSNNRQIEITKEKLKRLKELYCDLDEPMTINQVCRTLDIPRRDFILIKTAFGITHDDVPFLDEELENGNLDELVERTLEKKKGKFFIKYQQRQYEQMVKELEQYRRQGFVLNKIIDSLRDKGLLAEYVLPPIRPNEKKGNEEIIAETEFTEAQLNFADWHTGLAVENFWNSYNLKIQKERLDKLTQVVIQAIKAHNVRKLHVMNLGDLLHGIIHVSTRIVSEIDVIEQLKVTWGLIANILREFAKEVDEVCFYSTYGNHARITEKKQDALDRENLELLIPYFLEVALQRVENIRIMNNTIDDQIIVAEIMGKTIYAVHGDRDKQNAAAKNLTMMLERKAYKIFLAHTHHKEVIEEHKTDVIISRSLCGVDDFSKNIRSTSRAGQSLYIYGKDNLFITYDVTFN